MDTAETQPVEIDSVPQPEEREPSEEHGGLQFPEVEIEVKNGEVSCVRVFKGGAQPEHDRESEMERSQFDQLKEGASIDLEKKGDKSCGGKDLLVLPGNVEDKEPEIHEIPEPAQSGIFSAKIVLAETDQKNLESCTPKVPQAAATDEVTVPVIAGQGGKIPELPQAEASSAKPLPAKTDLVLVQSEAQKLAAPTEETLAAKTKENQLEGRSEEPVEPMPEAVPELKAPEEPPSKRARKPKQEAETKDSSMMQAERKDDAPAGWGKSGYISPEEQAAAKPKAKAKGKAKAVPKPKPEKVKRARGRPAGKSAQAKAKSKAAKTLVPKKDTARGRSAKTKKNEHNSPESEDAQKASRKRAGESVEAKATRKVRKVETDPHEALRSKRCCAYQKVLRSLLKQGIPKEEAQVQARAAALLHL